MRERWEGYAEEQGGELSDGHRAHALVAVEGLLSSLQGTARPPNSITHSVSLSLSLPPTLLNQVFCSCNVRRRERGRKRESDRERGRERERDVERRIEGERVMRRGGGVRQEGVWRIH